MVIENKNYFKAILKKGYLIPALFFAAIAATFILANYDFDLFSKIYHNKKVLAFLLIIAIIAVVILCTYLLAHLKSDKINLADSLALAIAFSGLFFLCYVLFAIKSFSFRRLIVILLPLIIGVGYILLRMKFFKKAISQTKKNYSAKSLKGYYVSVFEKYSFPGILCTAIVFFCALYLFFNKGFIRSFVGVNEYKMIIICIVLLLPFVFYIIHSAFDKNVNAVDALLLAGLIAIPAILVKLLTTSFTNTKMILWGILFLMLLALTYARYRCFDLSHKNANKVNRSCNCPIKSYFAKLFNKYNPLQILAIAGLITLTALILLKSRVLHESFISADGKIHIGYKLFTAGIIGVTAVITLALGTVTTMVNMDKKYIGIHDFLLTICLAFSILGFLTYIPHRSPYMLILLSAYLIHNVLLLISRIKIVNKN